ncbi:LEAF RUST 10 DISEASE-RESISTANCE LOCUS RECEPTOR-LIKE PROTEIN KINASE-like 2.3 [Sesamum alatum]|uniref:non-specific serine/threonine protein kinase n=1 Tax=Sesamum alatum TaxID=300844 RepID=A0AAE2CLL1_9LAMI|nr:LEAF RUST 10 DISEASE-RESISTANCE LOCUS RECEPTOR-LIKE PROTEIN KINASE-like 2.3 [Sesamum alatum]
MHTKPSQELFLFLLALATFLPLHFPGFYCQNVIVYDCRQPFQCGNISNIRYPFWGGNNQACGYPGFQLHNCQGDFPLLNIPPLSYRVLELNFSAHTLKVARQDLLNDTCPTDLHNTTLIPGPFDFAPNTSDYNVTLFFDCTSNQNQWERLTNQFSCNVEGVETINLFRSFRRGDTSSGPGPGITCKNNISVPVSEAAALELENSKSMDVLEEALAGGFVIRWPAIVDNCEGCTRYGGTCQFNSNSITCNQGSPLMSPPPPGSVYVIPRGIPPTQSPGYAPGHTISNGREQSPRFIIVVVVSTTGLVIISIIICSWNYGGVSHKSDVYSYGMMVLEMAGARKIAEAEATQSSENYFPDRIYEQVVLNVTINSNDFMIEEDEETGRKMFLVGFWCIQTNPSDRPSMSKVVEMLEGSLQSIPIPPKPVLFTPSFPISGPEFSSTLSAYIEIEESVQT